MRSRPQSGANIQGIDEADELNELDKVVDRIVPESPTELNKNKLDMHNEKLESELNDSIRGKNKSNTTNYNNSKQTVGSTGKRESLAN